LLIGLPGVGIAAGIQKCPTFRELAVQRVVPKNGSDGSEAEERQADAEPDRAGPLFFFSPLRS
jgi:hypothetical protein